MYICEKQVSRCLDYYVKGKSNGHVYITRICTQTGMSMAHALFTTLNISTFLCIKWSGLDLACESTLQAMMSAPSPKERSCSSLSPVMTTT